MTDAYSQRFTKTFTADTLTNADNGTFLLDNPLTKNYAMAWQVSVLELSGAATTATILQESLDGTNWFTVSTSTAQISSGTENFPTWIFNLTDTQGKYYRVNVAQTGTASTSVNVVVWVKDNY